MSWSRSKYSLPRQSASDALAESVFETSLPGGWCPGGARRAATAAGEQLHLETDQPQRDTRVVIALDIHMLLYTSLIFHHQFFIFN